MNNNFKELREAIDKYKVHDPTHYLLGVSLEYLRPILVQAAELLEEHDGRTSKLYEEVGAEARISRISQVLHGHPALRQEVK